MSLVEGRLSPVTNTRVDSHHALATFLFFTHTQGSISTVRIAHAEIQAVDNEPEITSAEAVETNSTFRAPSLVDALRQSRKGEKKAFVPYNQIIETLCYGAEGLGFLHLS
ncbi:hypothetical protein I317_05184 [Kwoniella heveanensis CBS 569]|nr:hypothetical protein I317_05184 [Kwoniella heveanensis CBS 569]